MTGISSDAGAVGSTLLQYGWAESTLGVPEDWSPVLRTIVGVMLGAKQPMFVACGDELTLLYNEGYAAILGDKHPAARGQPFFHGWAEIASTLRPIVEQTLGGSAVHMDDIALTVERHGYPE